MMKSKISCLLASVMVASSMITPITVLADDSGISTLSIIDGSVTIDKGDTSDGDTSLVPDKELDNVPEDGLGGITIKLPDTKDNLPKDGVKFSVTKIADIVDGQYVINEDLEDSGVDLNNIKNANELELASSTLSKIAPTDTTIITNVLGVCSKEDLEVGVYLVYAVDINNYENITPFIVSIPTWNDEKEVMTYDIEILPKHSPLPEDEDCDSPPTGTENKSLEYGLGALTCIALAGGLFVMNKVSKKSKNI